MEQRTIKQYPQKEQETGKETKAPWDTHAIMGKDQEKIATLAYALYEQRGREDGHALEDWLEAEQRVVSRGEGRGF